jgi:hypothetical protein
MTAGMNTRNLEAGRISLPRAGLGVLLAGTLLAGSVIGAATYAAINMANVNAAAHAAAISAALPKESTVVHDARIAAGHGQLAADGPTSGSRALAQDAIRKGQQAAGNGALAGDVRGVPVARDGFGFGPGARQAPVGRDGFGFGPASEPAPTVTIQHASGRGPLQ